MKTKIITVNNIMQQGYSYELIAPEGELDEFFQAELSPKELLELGIFGGKYFNDCILEYPKEWFKNAKLSGLENHSNPNLNYFKVSCGMSLREWREKNWIKDPDPRGWMEWYFRYYYGRRILELDKWQIKRWKNINRHISQVKKNCKSLDLECRKKQRQTLLHWAIDSTKI